MKMNNSIEEWERRVALLAILPWEKKLEELRYNPYHDPTNGRFASGSGGVSKSIDKAENSGIIKPDEYIGKSLGASGKNYPVKLPNGDHSKFAEGTEIFDIRIFAGKGTNNQIREAIFLENCYGIKSSEWVKVRGTGYVLDKGSPRKAEVHWYEAGKLKVKMKVKRWYDEG